MNIVITTKNIIDKKEPILFIEHDDEGDWIVQGHTELTNENALVTRLEKLLEIDNEIVIYPEINQGEKAMRTNTNEKWRVIKSL